MELLREGLRISPSAEAARHRHGKPPLRVRSGSCGGLDVVLPGGTYVNCPVFEHFAASSPFELVADGDEFEIRHEPSGDAIAVALVPAPAYYSARGADGTPLSQVAQLCSDRIGIGMTNRCVYWDSRTKRCKFCSIGLNTRSSHETRDKSLAQILEAVDAAFTDPVAPARHVLLGGGTPKGKDAGAIAIARAATAIKERWPDRSVYAMIAPPAALRYVDLLHAAGVDELGMNVELFDAETASDYMPGKHQEIGISRYFAALEHAVGVFGPINTRSITIAGLDPPGVTVQGVGRLASMGVMPILCPFRPLVGTAMEHHPRVSSEDLWKLTNDASDAAGQYGIPLGPTCVPCQANTLNAPGHPAYRYY